MKLRVVHNTFSHVRSRDFYHTCYCLSGLSLSQHCVSKTINITRSNADIIVSSTSCIIMFYNNYNIFTDVKTKLIYQQKVYFEISVNSLTLGDAIIVYHLTYTNKLL